MHINISIFIYIYVYIYIYKHTYIYAHIHMYAYTCMCVYICLCIHIYIYINTCIHMYSFLFIYIYLIHIFVHVYVYLNTYICIYTLYSNRREILAAIYFVYKTHEHIYEKRSPMNIFMKTYFSKNTLFKSKKNLSSHLLCVHISLLCVAIELPFHKYVHGSPLFINMFMGLLST